MSEQNLEKRRKYLPIVIAGVILAALCGISLYLRIALSYDYIFVNNETVWFRETDAYYYMRHIESVIHNFPHFNAFDPYQLFPGGMQGLPRPFYAWLVAAVILVVKGAAASLHGMEVVAAYMPAILGTLTLIPVYFIGKELFNRWVGVISAALVMIIPSEFMHRSLLGFGDHHVTETLFSTVSILFLIMAIKRAREREITFAHLRARNWSTIRKPLIYALLAGIFLGVYLLAWIGGLLFLFIICAYLVIQFIVDHLRHRSTDYLCIIGTPVFLIAFLMLLPILGHGGTETVYRISMSVAIVIPVVLSMISRVMSGRTLKPVYYPVALVGLAVIGLVALYASNPSLFQYMRSLFGVFTPSGATLTIMEVAPLLFPGGQFSLAGAWSNFNTSFFISAIAIAMLAYPTAKERWVDRIVFAVWIIVLLITVRSQWVFGWFIFLAMLVYLAIKEESAGKILLLVWSIIILMAVLGQRRFGYYYTVNIALLTGYFTWKMLDIAGLSKLLSGSREVVKAVKKFKKKEKKNREQAGTGRPRQPAGVWARVIVVGIVLFAIVFLPSIPGALALAGSGNFVMDEGWYNSLLWLKDSNNSPEPFDDPDFYYELYPPQNEFEYPATAYGVMSWWDYGHFIMQLAHRIPNANPTQTGAVQAGQFFTALNESAANEVADEEGTKYVVIDFMMATSKFYAMARWANKSENDFFRAYYAPVSNQAIQQVGLYYSTYYNSTVARLYNFDGQPAGPSGNSTIAVSWERKTGQELLDLGYRGIMVSQNQAVAIDRGNYYNVIVGYWFFSSPEEAETYVSSQQSGNYDIGGLDPFNTIVPLGPLNSYERVYPTAANITVNSTTVKIFRYLGSGGS